MGLKKAVVFFVNLHTMLSKVKAGLGIKGKIKSIAFTPGLTFFSLHNS